MAQNLGTYQCFALKSNRINIKPVAARSALMTYIKIVILDGLDVAMNPNVAVATAESDEQIREAENKTADASMSNAPTIDLLFIMILLL